MTLRALDRQVGLNGRFEVIVAVDGSTDATGEILRSIQVPFDLKTIVLDPGGPARARNAAIREATGQRILLLGDDTIPLPGIVAIHGASSGSYKHGVQGAIEWDPEVGITDVMRFLAPEGPQFWFKRLKTGSIVPWSSVVSSNLSAPRKWFLEEPFNEIFTDASMEDSELAYRWHRLGRYVVFNKQAVCRHRHRYDSIDQFLRRQSRAGRWARTMVALHPKLFHRLLAEPVGVGILVVLRNMGRKCVGKYRLQDTWDLRCRLAYVRGFLGG